MALNALLGAPRISRDIDRFHDTQAALSESWASDRGTLTGNGFEVSVIRESPSFVEAFVTKGGARTALQWTRDSAYRFFPLIVDEQIGLTLHPFDLATNKVLALVGRLEVRDWVDVLSCDRDLQPLGCLIWAACGKDPGYNPKSLLAASARQHYSQAEVDTLEFEGSSPDASELGERWHEAQREASRIIASLPADRVGTCVALGGSELFRGHSDELATALEHGRLTFHAGTIGLSWPTVIG